MANLIDTFRCIDAKTYRIYFKKRKLVKTRIPERFYRLTQTFVYTVFESSEYLNFPELQYRFPYLSIPGHHMVTDEGLLAETLKSDPLMNVLIAFKVPHLQIFVEIRVAGVVQHDDHQTFPRTSTNVQFTFSFDPLRPGRGWGIF